MTRKYEQAYRFDGRVKTYADVLVVLIQFILFNLVCLLGKVGREEGRNLEGRGATGLLLFFSKDW